MSSSQTAVAISDSSLRALPGEVSPPTYLRSALIPSILHIGVGAFHRSHLATYVDDLLRLGHTQWSIMGSGVLPSDAKMKEGLERQNYLFCMAARGAEETTVRVVGSIVGYVLGWPDGGSIVCEIAKKETQVVSMTVTEGGYPVDDSTGEFNGGSEVAKAGSAFDVLVRGLEARRLAGGWPITVLSCDNVVGNGDVARCAAFGMAKRLSGELLEWMKNNVTFPNSMVDRITPATRDVDKEWLRTHFGVEDACPVMTEPFRQWVIEDKFAGARLPLEKIDVIVTDDVAQYERMKLRLLNAGHCCLAYSAALLGYELVHEAMGDSDIARFVRAFMQNEAAPVLSAPPGIVLQDYIESLMVRFSNPCVRDQVSRLCLDGSAKLPKFLFPTVAAQLGEGGQEQINASALMVASWCQYLLGTSETGVRYHLSPDPRLQEAADFARRSTERPEAFLEFDIFADGLSTDSRFVLAFRNTLEVLRNKGTRKAISDVVDN